MTLSREEYTVRAGDWPLANSSIERAPQTTLASVSDTEQRPVICIRGAREQRWIRAHEVELTAQYGGQWIAVSGDVILGAGDDASQAYEKAKAKGFADAAIVQIPTRSGEWDNLIF